jgi:PAS domain S-box-containing protein
MYAGKENIDTLVGLGLSGTQARICLALAVNETSTLREISEASGVARPDTYRALLELENRGLIEKIVSIPTKYKLLSLPELLSILVGRRETESIELQEKSAKLLKEYQKKITDRQAVSTDQFVLVPGGKAFSNRLRKSIENSKKSICAITYQKTLTQLLDYMQGKLKRAIGNDVNVRILTEKRRNSSLAKRLFNLQKRTHFEIRFANILPPFSLATFDEKEILLSTKAQSENDSALAVYSNNSSLAELSQNYFNEAWFSASESAHQEFKRDKLQFDYLFANMINGFAYCKMIFDDEGKPVDFVFLQVNEAFERITGLTRGQVIGKRATRVTPEMKTTNPELLQTYQRVSRSGKPEEFEVFIKPYNCWRRVSVYSPKRGYFALVFEDITERKKAEDELKQRYDFLESLGENVDAGLVIVDRDFRIVWANKVLRNVGALTGELCYKRLAHAEAVCPDCGVAKIFNQNVPVDIHEYKGVNSKGETNWVELRVTPLKDEKGNIRSALELAVSINERKKAEQKLRESETKYRNIFDNAEAGIFRTKLDGSEILDCNAKFLRILGRTRKEVMGKPSFIHWANPLERQEMVRLLQTKGQVDDFECRLLNKQGEVRTCLTTLKLYPEQEILEGSIIDITERKEMEEELRVHSEIVVNASEGVHVTRISDGLIVYANQQFEKMFGYAPGELNGKPVAALNAPANGKSPQEVAEEITKCLKKKGAWRGEIENVKKDGTHFWCKASVSTMHSSKYGEAWVAVHEDITERKKAEKALLEKQLELNLIFDSSPILIFFKDREGKFKQINRAFAQALKMPKEKLLGKTVFDIYSAEIAGGLTDDDAEVLESKLPKLGIIGSYPSPTGLRWVRTDKIPTLDENGAVDGLIGFSEDITEQKKAELELKHRYNLLESISENIDAGLAIIDKNYRIVWANKTLRNVGANSGELCYENLGHTKTICPDCGVKKIFEQNIPADIHEYKNITPKGETRWIELRATPLKDENGNTTAALELAVPINERKKAETERETMIEFLKIANAAASTRDLIKASADFFQKQVGCEAVGIRLKEGDDYPYYETRGFPPAHVRLENRLCAVDEAGCPIRDFKGNPVLECMCGNVICGRFDPSKKFFTAKGSFWTNSTTELLASTTEEDRQARTRNRCNGEGYESVALLALRVGDDRFGLLQLNDKRKNIFTLETIQTWERIADHLALALSKTISKESLEKCERERIQKTTPA